MSVMLADEGSVTAGEVWVDGENVTGMAAHHMVRNGMMHVLEGRYVFPDLTVHENLRMGAYTRKDRQNIEADLEQVFRSEEHTSELQSRGHLVCRLLLENKKTT